MNMPKFHCRRQSGMNFGYVTVNGVNSNVWELFYSLCVPLTTLIPRSSIILQICVILGHSCFPSGRRQTPTWMVLIFSLTSLSIFSRIPLSSMGSIGLTPLHSLHLKQACIEPCGCDADDKCECAGNRALCCMDNRREGHD